LNIKGLQRSVIKTVFPLLAASGIHRITRPWYAGMGSILMFHRVCPDENRARMGGASGLEVTPEYLEQSIQFLLANDYDLVSLDRVADILNEGKAKRKFVAFTFDDGYADNFNFAYPVLKKYKVPFTIYVTTSFPERSAILWWYLLEDLVLNHQELTFEWEGQTIHYACSNRSEKESSYKSIHKFIAQEEGKVPLNRIKAVFKNYVDDLHLKTDELALSWEQIRELSADPLVTIGAHTVNHYALSKLPDAEVEWEITESKKRLENKIEKNVEHFSYPFGSRAEAGDREFEMAKLCGFKTVTTTRIGNIFCEHKNSMERLPRIPVNEKRDGKDTGTLMLWLNGMLPGLLNKFNRVVTT